MDKKTQAVYKDIEIADIDLIIDADSKENVLTLIKAGYIVDAEKDELATVKLGRELGMHNRLSLSLTIAPTMACNMQCPYCYENKDGRVMTAEIQDMLVEFVKTHLCASPSINTLSVNWYGGEPLLQKKIIYNLSEKFLNICSERGIQYRASMVTNGSLLDAETAKKLVEDCKVSNVQITIDGMPKRHNMRRIFVDGTDSFDVIVKNIEDCRDFLPISVRVNVDRENISDVESLLKYFVEEKRWKGNPHIYIAPVKNYTASCKQECFQNQEFADASREFNNSYYAVDRDIVTSRLFQHRPIVFCGAECVENYVIDPEGYYYNCWLLIGDKRRNSGHISKPYTVSSEYYKWLSIGIPQKCESCEYLPMCVGGCPYYRVDHINEPTCPNSYYTYKDNLRLAYFDYVEQKKKKAIMV